MKMTLFWRRNLLLLSQLCLFLTVGAMNAAAAWPTRLFAPYADFTAWPPYDIVGEGTNTGLRYATLAFIVADTSQNATSASPTNIPAWGGYTAYSAASGYRLGDIETFRALGGDVVISFGGAAGTELAEYITDTNRLQAAYQSVVTRYSATRIDFDIEGAADADKISINRRSTVLAALQAAAAAAGKTLQISLTLPVLPTGLDADGLYVLQSAVSNGVNLATVNIMTMDYGDGAAPNPSGKMGTYAIQAATNLFLQLKSVYAAAHLTKTDAQLWQMVGLTPLLGVNDVSDETFDQTAAAQVVAYATSQNLGMLAFWSLNRDVPGGAGITQTTNQFTDVFLAYGNAASPTPVVSAGDAGVILPKTGVTNLVFPVTLSVASTGAVSVAYFTGNGTAAAPGDYAATNGTLVFTAGQTARTVSVPVYGSTNAGANKSFYLNLTNVVGANLFAAQATGTIINNNTGGGSTGSGIAAITQQWQVTYAAAGFTAVLTLSNPNRTNITINSLAFNAPYASVSWIACDTNLFDWVVPTQSGTLFTINQGWSPAAVIPANGSLELTFSASPGGSSSIAPTNVVINGIALGSHGGVATVPQLKSMSVSGRNIVLSWQPSPGQTNVVQVSTNLLNWTTVSPPVYVTGSVGSTTTNWTDVGGTTNGRVRFYRVMLEN